MGEELSPLLVAAGRDPASCEVFFLETEKLNAASLGQCMFGFTTGLAATGDRILISGVAAHEVAHEVLGHADKRQAAVAITQGVQEVVRAIPGWGPLAALGVMAVGMVALPAYSRAQEANADAKAIELLRARGDADPGGTMVHTFEVLLAREGAKGGGVLGSHPHMAARLEAMRDLQPDAPCSDPPPAPPQQAAAVLPKASRQAGFFSTREPPDPRAGWSERYKTMAEKAAEKAEEADANKTPNDSKASE